MKTLFLLLLVFPSAAFADEDITQQIRRYTAKALIPDYIEYTPPEPFFRAKQFADKPSPPDFYHPSNGGYDLSAELKFTFRPVGAWMGEGKRISQAPIAWEDLKQAIQKRGSIAEGSSSITEPLIDGKKVLLFDYQQKLRGNAPWPFFYTTVLWIPVDDNVVIEGIIVCTTPELRESLRSQLLKLKIKKYKEE